MGHWKVEDIGRPVLAVPCVAIPRGQLGDSIVHVRIKYLATKFYEERPIKNIRGALYGVGWISDLHVAAGA
jgi:hypothetical protein